MENNNNNNNKPQKVKIASIQPVQVEVIAHTPQTTDIESNLPQATEVRPVMRISTLQSFIGTVSPEARRRIQPLTIGHTLTEREKILMEGYRISRLIRLLTVIEIGFVLLFGILVPPFLCVLPFPLCGYFGARRWNACLLYIFAVYSALEVVVGIISLFFFFTQPVYFGLRIVDIAFNALVLRYANQVTAFAKVLEPQDRNFLMNSQTVKSIEQGLLF